MRPEIHDVDVELAVGAGEPCRYPELCVDHTVQVSGVFVADLRLEVSNDGATWVQHGAAIVAPGILSLAGLSFRMLRIRTAAYTSGTPEVRYGGMNVRVEA